MKKPLLFVGTFFLLSCGKKAETTKPIVAPISESIYASGLVKSQNQYQAFATVNGIIQDILLQEGDTVKKGMAILTIAVSYTHLDVYKRQAAAKEKVCIEVHNLVSKPYIDLTLEMLSLFGKEIKHKNYC